MFLLISSETEISCRMKSDWQWFHPINFQLPCVNRHRSKRSQVIHSPCRTLVSAITSYQLRIKLRDCLWTHFYAVSEIQSLKFTTDLPQHQFPNISVATVGDLWKRIQLNISHRPGHVGHHSLNFSKLACRIKFVQYPWKSLCVHLLVHQVSTSSIFQQPMIHVAAPYFIFFTLHLANGLLWVTSWTTLFCKFRCAISMLKAKRVMNCFGIHSKHQQKML